MPFTQQWLQRDPNPPAIGALEITAENRRINVVGAPSISREDLTAKLLRRAVVIAHPPAWHPKRTNPAAGRDRPFESTVAIALASLGAFMARRSERRRELPFEHGFAYLLSKLRFEVLAKIAKPTDGACPSCYSPAWRTLAVESRRICFSQQGGYAILLFLQESGRIRSGGHNES
jgi:hypothetical protein